MRHDKSHKCEKMRRDASKILRLLLDFVPMKGEPVKNFTPKRPTSAYVRETNPILSSRFGGARGNLLVSAGCDGVIGVVLGCCSKKDSGIRNL